MTATVKSLLLSLLGFRTEHSSPPVPDHALSAAVDAYVKTKWHPSPPVQDCGIRFRRVTGENRAPGAFPCGTALTWGTSRYYDPLKRTSPEPFAAFVMKLIRDRNLSEVEVYTKARLDKRQFAKIRKGARPTGKFYTPSKETAVALALALELSLDEASILLKKAGLALSDAIKADVIVCYFLENRRYSVDEANTVLYANGCPLLGTQSR